LPLGALIRGVVAAAALITLLHAAPSKSDEDPVARGAYLATAAGCANCHTDGAHGGKPYAGGLALGTPFGTFYSPNITPDPETGIGRWTDAQFLRALREGVRADGANLFPVFPYTSYTLILDEDARAIKAFLFSLPPVRQPNRSNDVSFPFSWRFLQNFWKLLFFEEGPFKPALDRSAAHNRGAYLVSALAHCGECHTPRNSLGGLDTDRFLAGAPPPGPDGKKAPNITPDRQTGIGDWSEDDIVGVLTDGRTPTFDEVGGPMAEVVKDTAQLTQEDRRAIAVYLRSVPPKKGSERK
jgi:mono/diheme cytochrome c family protein